MHMWRAGTVLGPAVNKIGIICKLTQFSFRSSRKRLCTSLENDLEI